MGLQLQVQVFWVLSNLCMLVLGSSGVGEPLSLESYSVITPVESQVSRSGFERGLVLKPPTASPSIKSPPLHQNGKGQPPVLSPTQSGESATPSLKHGSATPAPTQRPHDSSPPLVVERPHYSTSPHVTELAYAPSTMVPPVDSTSPPVNKLAHAPSTMVSPVDRTPPPGVETAHAPSAMVLPVDTAPPPVAKSAHTPSATVLPVASTPPPVAETAHGPSAMVSPVNTTSPPVTEPPHPFDTPPVAKPPQVLTSEPPVKTPPFLPTLPLPYGSPQHAPIIPVLSPPSQMGPSQVSSPAVLVPSNVSVPPPLTPPFPLEPPPGPPPSLASPPPTNEPALYEPPPPAGDTPPFDVPPTQAPSELPGAEPPHTPSLPLAANPPLLPVAEPPEASTHISPPGLQPVFPSLPPITAVQSPPIPLSESSPPPQITPPIASSSPPQLPSLNASSPIPTLIPHISPPTPGLPMSSPPLMVPPPIDSSPDLRTLSPHMPQNTSAVPPQISPPQTSPTTQLPHLNASSPVTPVMAPSVAQNASSMTAPPIATSTPSQLVVPPPLSPPTQTYPPSSSFSPPLMVPPPMDSLPELPTPSSPIPQNASAPPPQMDPLHKSSPPPLLPSLNASSPVPPLIPHISPPTPALPPNSSFPPPLMTPPPVPQNASSLIAPPTAPSPPPQLIVPPPLSPPTEAFPPSPSISPPLMVPPSMVSPPNLPTSPPLIRQNASSPPPLLVSPPLASPPTSVSPSLPLLSPPPMMLPPASPSLSPPVPTQAVPPLPHLVPPHSFSPPLADPPQVFSAPPPIKLPVTPPPSSSTVPGAIPPRPSSPPPFLSPPISSSPQEKASPGLASPPVMVPSHALFAPPPSKLDYPFVPPPAGNRTVPALPPHTSQRKVTQHEAPPPLLTSPDISPPSINSSRAAPPFKQPRPESTPPILQPVEAPKHSSSSSRLNASASPEPEFERQNETAPAPSFFQVNPINGSHHSRYRSPGAPMAVSPLPSSQGVHEISSAASPVPHAPPGDSQIPFLSPEISPSGSTSLITKRPLAPPLRSLPPPPPNTDCAYITCPAPSTNTPPGSPCGCVWPMQVGIRLSVALYTFFPLVSELAQEIASGTFLKPSQVRVMGANAAAQEPEKTIVLVDLLPLDGKFDNITSHLIFDRFYHKQVVIDKSIFGDYDVLYVRYPGLPPSPPMAPSDIAVINGMPYSVGDPNGSKLHPLGVDVTKQRHKHRINAIIIAVIVLSAVLGVLMCCSLAWVLVFRHANNHEQPTLTPRAVGSLGRSSGPTGLSTGSGQSSPLSLGSSLTTYTGSAKTFSGREIEKATDNFNSSRILGEGGFGLVYSGDLDDDTQVAVKVLKRDDQQGGREFLAEVEMLGRLHHRNLVKLIGICTNERMRSLVYELIPNGSVDSHLHGTDKEIAPLDWASRLKIALGAARGLAYLHEDSSPRVIHRDFKSSNILLENDFTPKVSDFGLARSAMDEENQHISTRVMGTFGYVAPEYAMTGHLLVKSDVYSYGVVLLELLTGRKPVDMSMPAGQESLVSWTRPLLTTKEGLESIIDPSLGSQVPFESVAKVAAIASMCVQPEVSHRPFMGEVVQALKLVCNECDDSKDGEDSRTHSRENLSIDFDAKVNSPVSGTSNPLHGQFLLPNYTSGHDVEKGLSVSEIFCASKSLGEQASDSFRRHSSSGPLRTTRGRHFWQRTRRESHGSTSEHGIMYRLWASSH